MIIQGKVWGVTTPLFNKNNVELHIIKIKKGGYCSKHLHKFKFNRFIVLEGKLKVTIWKNYGTEILQDISVLDHSQECTVSPGDYHKFDALEDTTALEVYWVELSESDIIRQDHGGIEDASSLSNSNRTIAQPVIRHPAYALEYGHIENTYGPISSDK